MELPRSVTITLNVPARGPAYVPVAPGEIISAPHMALLQRATSAEEDWDDVVVTQADAPVTLACSDWPLKGTVQLEWQWKPDGQDSWSVVLKASHKRQFGAEAQKADVRMADPRFHASGNFSLFFRPRAGDGGRYCCLTGGKRERQRVTLLAILAVVVSPSPPVPLESILRLYTNAPLSEAVSEVVWLSPKGLSLHSETKGLSLHSETLPSGSSICKLPNFRKADEGNYTCQVRPRGKASRHHFHFIYRITVNDYKRAKFTDPGNRLPTNSTACVHGTPVPISCPRSGDYVVLYRQPPANAQQQIFSYDRWRRIREVRTKARLRLDASADSGHFLFLLEAELQDGGVYRCEVFLNDNVFVQGTGLSVLKVSSKSKDSKLTLLCQYSFRPQVREVTWTHQNQSHSRKLLWTTTEPGRLQTVVPLGPQAAGNYTCTLELKNDLVVRAVHTVPPKRPATPPPTVPVNTSSSSPSLLTPLSGLGVLLPLAVVAVVTVGVLLWKRGYHNTRPGVEQSLSHHSGEVENVYENPEDLRQSTGQSSVYMDLKPTSDDDVYKELDRYEQCPC
ncbi:g6f-like [Conger conger]|uniref:g6f-like n=1 Tax=Conger conger TaxID=82655 RepID=UPI002A5A46C7|nr:g6f-like [Conger conger]